MPSIKNNSHKENTGVNGDCKTSETTALLLSRSSTIDNSDQVGNYLGFNASLDEDIDAIGMAETITDNKTNTESSTSAANKTKVSMKSKNSDR